MKQFVPFEKCSKKEQKRRNALRRKDWGGVDPVTKVAETNAKRYRRKEKHPKRMEHEW